MGLPLVGERVGPDAVVDQLVAWGWGLAWKIAGERPSGLGETSRSLCQMANDALEQRPGV